MSRLPIATAYIAMVLLIQAPLGAQTAGQIRGTVVDAAGRVVTDSTVIISGLGDGRTTESRTDRDGRYADVGLPTGLYTVTAVKDELGSEVFRVRVRNGQTVEVNFALEPGRRAAAYLSEASDREALSRIFTAGLDSLRSGRHAAAVDHFLSALELSPTCIECHFNLAVSYTELGQLGDTELESQRVLLLKPNYAAAYYGLSGIYARQDRLDEAADARGAANRIAIERLESDRAQAQASIERGIGLLEAGNVADAIVRFGAAVDHDANLAAAHYWLGQALAESGRSAQSRSSLRRYLQLDPDGEFADHVRELLGDPDP